jgi:nitrous oxidase accessory protein
MVYLIRFRASVEANQSIRYVGVGAYYSTIQEAINAASPGDTIFVYNGTYVEDVVVNKSVSLIGQERGLVIVRGSSSQQVVSIQANGVVFRDLTVNGSANAFAAGILVSSLGCNVSNNLIENNFYGLYILSSGNTISDNIVSDNNNGVSVYFSGNDVFSRNAILDNALGLRISSSSSSVFSENVLLGNSQGLVLSDHSNNNVFYHNNFYDSVQSNDSLNLWSSGNEGNYWVNYTGHDLNDDGIGSEPYSIDAVNKDNYPLMGMFYDLTVNLKTQTFDATAICNSTVSGFRFEIGQETGNRIVHLDVAGQEGNSGFCRVMIPTGLMPPPYIIIGSEGEIVPTMLSISNQTNVYLYFVYSLSNQTISIISSNTLELYNELYSQYQSLQATLASLNATYYYLLDNYTARLQMDLDSLNATYHTLSGAYASLSGNLDQLQNNYAQLNSSYQQHLSDYSQKAENLQNLMYVFAALTLTFLITTVYLSRRTHSGTSRELQPS